MPKLIEPIIQRGVSTSRFVAIGIAKDLIRTTGLPKDTEIIVIDASGGVRQRKNIHDVCGNNDIRTDYNNIMFVSFTEEFTENDIVRHRMNNERHRNIFIDEQAGVFMTPTYGKVLLNLEIVVRSSDRTVLEAWQSWFRTYEGTQFLQFQHDIRYDYSFPHRLLDLVHDTYQLMYPGDQPEGHFKQYLKEKMGTGVSKRKNSSGTHTEVIVNEAQTHVVGRFADSTFYNTIESDEGKYQMTFTYGLLYDQILTANGYMPAVINNKVIPKKYVDMIFPATESESTKGFMPKGFIANPRQNQIEKIYRGDGGKRLLNWDEYFPENPMPDTQTVLLVPVLVDANNPRSIGNLNDLPKDLVPEGVKGYLSKYHGRHGAYRHSLVGIELYCTGVKEEFRSVRLDEDLNITAARDMNPKDRNYMRITIIKDLASFDNEHVAELMLDPDVFFPVLQLYDKDLKRVDSPDHPEELPTDICNPGGRSYPKLIHVKDGLEITPTSYSLWLRKHKWSNDTYKGLACKARVTALVNNLRAARRKKGM